MLLILGTAILMTGCATTNKDQLYYDATKSVSKDQTVTQSACWAAVAEVAKGGDNTVKMGAIALAEKCKSMPVKIEAPQKSWFSL